VFSGGERNTALWPTLSSAALLVEAEYRYALFRFNKRLPKERYASRIGCGVSWNLLEVVTAGIADPRFTH